LNIEHIQHAFSPAHEITDPQMFVGRKDEIRSALLALQNPGGFLALYGQRGVGKSSLARQIQLIAEGNNVVPKMLELERYLPRRGFDYMVRLVQCDKSVRSTADILNRLLFGDDSNEPLLDLSKSGQTKAEQTHRTVNRKGELNIFGSKVTTEYKHESIEAARQSDSLVQDFRMLLGLIQKDNTKKTGLLILLDEFDIVENKDGFGSLVKACSSEFVKFGIIGIAQSIPELMKDHVSVGRKIDGIKVGKMAPPELDLIIRRAEYKVRRAIRFDELARNAIIERSEGFPYFTHLLGKEAMLLAFERNLEVIDEGLVTELADRVVAGRLPTVYEEAYFAAIGGSRDRELLLKAFAESETEEIRAAPVLALAAGMGVTQAEGLMSRLVSAQDDQAVLVEVRDGYYRFSDPVFRVYARLRNWEL
jgi:hypothetical protein